MNERTPLLRAVPRKREQSIKRYAGIILSGFVLYCVYILLFLPRTSYQRDWNHLHDNTITRQELERWVVQKTDPDSIYSYAQSYYLSGEHLPGSAPQLAEWTRTKFEELGLETKISTHKTLVNLPLRVSVRVLDEEDPLDLDLNEPGLDLDPPTQLESRVPAFHAYAANGTVSGRLVYGDHARISDMLALRDRGIELEGTVLLARTGKLPLHIQVKNAKIYGCLAVLSYNDYADDGLYTPTNGFDSYPDGPARNPDSISRDTVLDYTQKPGQIPRHGIPSVPISIANAQKLLARTPGPGPGPVVEVTNLQSTEERTLSNVIGTIKGYSGQEVIIGNHRDAFVLGAADGNSGSAVLLELARVLGELHKQGWKPFRTIKFASWDGGRYGMLGSTAWARENKHHLRKHAATYIDIGAAYTGPEFIAKASPLLRSVIRECARRSPAPDLNGTLHEYWESGPHGHTHIGSLDTGDFNVFYNHLGIPSMSARFQGNKTSHVYHRGSNYDTLHWQKTFGDTDFGGHAALSRVLGLVVGRLVSMPVLPLRVTDYGRVIQRNVLQMLGEREEYQIEKLHDACSQFLVLASEYDNELNRLELEYVMDYPWYKFWKKLQLGIMMHVSNFKLAKIEQTFLYHRGLTGRPWYRHTLFGPDRKNSGTRALPGLHEALEDNDTDEIFYWVGVLTQVMRDAALLLA